MTNYNDGKWHGWNGGGCPVHPKSRVDIAGSLGITNAIAGELLWDDKIAAFRVVKEYREPREWWIGGSYICETKQEAIKRTSNGHSLMSPIIHVREVLE